MWIWIILYINLKQEGLMYIHIAYKNEFIVVQPIPSPRKLCSLACMEFDQWSTKKREALLKLNGNK